MGKIVWVGAGCIALILVVGGWNVLAANVLHGEVTPRKLFVSVTNVSGGGDPFDYDSHRVCHRVSGRAGSWTCDVADPRGSGGGVLYRVEMEGASSCWHARGTYQGGEARLPRKISGCVHVEESD
jgi:hypothetical protein